VTSLFRDGTGKWSVRDSHHFFCDGKGSEV